MPPWWNLRNVLVVDALVVGIYLSQLLFWRSQFLTDMFGTVTESLDDLLWLFTGIYVSWFIILLYLIGTPISNRRSLARHLCCSAALNLIIGLSCLRTLPAYFYSTNAIMLFLWTASFASFSF